MTRIEELIEDLFREVRGLRADIAALRRSLPPQLGSMRDAAKILQCDPSTVYRAWKRGEIAGRQIGGRIYIDLAALRPVTEDEAVAAAYPAVDVEAIRADARALVRRIRRDRG